jgi:hypothetical protein
MKMASHHAPTVAPPTVDRRSFTLAQANRALTYIEPIVRDIQDTYRQAVSIQQRLEFPASQRETRDLTEDHDRAMAKLSLYVDELVDTGAELKDYERGQVDFPAELDGRTVLLCWKVGEPTITHWHEADAGPSDRQPVADYPFDA